ncbi:class I SAM-dependent RNA methyltransferase, partial [candidate division WOR-3 bacterium]|nr:class I SAM-dependent RNA methyltransferase [candidate division WOR-3 bacterium]
MVVDLQVDRLVTGGDGIAELDGLKVFVPFAAPQERVRARVVVRKRDYAVASIEAILEPSPLRVNPPCRYYGACGGCQIQHIDYAGQLIAKKLMVNDALQHVGRIFLPVRNLAGDGAPFHYRNKTQYPVTRNGDLRIGFFRRGTHSVIDVAECLLHPPAFDRLRAVAAEAIGRWEAPYQERQHAGNVRHLVVREGEEGLQVLLATREASVRPELAEAIASHPGVAGVVQSLNPARTN